MNKDKLNYREFIERFNFPVLGYNHPVEFIDENFGFSVLKEYGDGYASLLSIFISKKDLEKNNDLFPLTITANYGKKTESGLMYASSSEKVKKIFDPIDLVSTNDFYYNKLTKTFLYKKFIIGICDIKPKNILSKINKLHEKPTRPFLGLWLRIKIVFWRLLVTNILKFISKVLIFILYICSGTLFKSDIWSRIIFPDKVEKESVTSTIFTDKRSIDFFGYQASAWSITVYCLIHFLVYVLFFLMKLRPDFVKIIIENSFITIIYVVVTLTVFDVLLPKLLKYMIRKTDNLFHITSYKRIKI